MKCLKVGFQVHQSLIIFAKRNLYNVIDILNQSSNHQGLKTFPLLPKQGGWNYDFSHFDIPKSPYNEEYLKQLLNVSPGSVTPFGLLNKTNNQISNRNKKRNKRKTK